ncbi:aldo-keto reductase family 4 member C10 [Selaginella moellendorffii]|uniref:aldo-keto reductase family 4 member C10 n=1 Tax=Selaginella moellendorffii TaxID=88036 RepID=UPI000D1CF273|nr:aldo-keto reductase family 4 member C10 [Selaginella moellendorffii]|eukprot:XP_024527269.1 aldo-keto reductase family 4 member C10 [Selaginella moellendorffii]
MTDFFPLNTGARIPAVGLGTWEADGEACTRAVRFAALEAGYRHIDCSHLYGNEIQVGLALREILGDGGGIKREDLFLTSKLWFTAKTPRHVETCVDASLRNLGLDYLDLYLLHWPTPAPMGDATDPPPAAALEHREEVRQIKDSWQAMEALLATNKVRAIGVSNFGISQLQELLGSCLIVPAVNQVELHPFWRQDDLVEFCKRKGIHVSAHTPLGIPGTNIGSLQLPSNGESSNAEGKTFLRTKSVNSPMLKASVVAAIAEELGKTPAQVILRWGLQRGTSVLPRSLTPERIKLNIDILDWCLADDDWKAINAMEPQVRLINSTFSYLSENAPLQAVKEDEVEQAENI